MSYPKITDDDFNEEITRKFKKYKIPRRKLSFDQICFPKEYKLQNQQEFLGAYINPKTPYKSILVWHRIGAGKTCTAIRIGEAWKHERKIVVVLPASLIGNFRSELRTPCAGNNYMKESERNQLAKLHPSSVEYSEIIERSDARINKYYRIYSFNKFVELAEENAISLNNTVLIIDEVHNVVSEEGKFYDVIYRLIHQSPSDLRTVVLTATPMINLPNTFGLLMNLLRIPFEFPEGREFDRMFISKQKNKKNGQTIQKAKNLDKLKEMIRGYVSYYGGAQADVFPSFTIKYVKCEFNDFQYAAYLTVLKGELEQYKKSARIQAFRSGDLNELPNTFLIGTRAVSNLVFPNKRTGEAGFESFKGKHLDMDNLATYSIKFYKIMKAIKRSPGPVFVYSAFKEFNGIKSFVKVLEHHGYVNAAQYGSGRKRYAVWSGDEPISQRQEIKEIYNHPDNVNGSQLKIILGTPAMSVGISLLSTRQVHVIDVPWSQGRLDQIVGRAIRFCSHKRLPLEDQFVRVYIYLGTHPDIEETVDQYIAKLAHRKEQLIEEFETAIKEASIDCQLFMDANIQAGDENIVCDA
jgi:hypothetical protein